MNRQKTILFFEPEIAGHQLDYIEHYVDSFEYALNGSNFADTSIGYAKYIDVNSFIELYKEQALAEEVISFLNKYSFKLKGVYNMYYDKNGVAIQGDFLFTKR